MSRKIYINCDHTIRYKGARNGSLYLNNGTCTWSLIGSEEGDVEIANGTVDYVAASDGLYEGILDKAYTDGLEENKIYYLSITFHCSGFDDFRRLSLTAAYRT